jgi:hypothetical protein
MRRAATATLLLCLTLAIAWGQQGATEETTLTVRAPLVQVPVLVKAKAGRVVFGLTAGDFVVTDNGVPQRLTLDTDTGGQPLALAVVVETGGAGARHLADYGQLDSILDALIGNVEHRAAVIGFDSTPHVLAAFSPKTADAALTLARLDEGDQGAAILDAIAFAVDKLRAQPARDSAAERDGGSGEQGQFGRSPAADQRHQYGDVQFQFLKHAGGGVARSVETR